MYNIASVAEAIDYQKTIFDKAYSTIVKLQDQGNKMVDWTIESNTLIPESTKTYCTYWQDFFKQNQENYKIYVDTSFDRVKDFFETATPVEVVKTAVKKSK